MPLDTANHFGVCAKGDKILVHNILVRDPIPLSREEAINLAAWLIAMADELKSGFTATIEASVMIAGIRKT